MLNILGCERFLSMHGFESLHDSSMEKGPWMQWGHQLMHFISHHISLNLTNFLSIWLKEAPKLEYQNLVQVYTTKYRGENRRVIPKHELWQFVSENHESVYCIILLLSYYCSHCLFWGFCSGYGWTLLRLFKIIKDEDTILCNIMIRLSYIVKLCTFIILFMSFMYFVSWLLKNILWKECWICQRWWSILSHFLGMGLELMSFGWALASRVVTPSWGGGVSGPGPVIQHPG